MQIRRKNMVIQKDRMRKTSQKNGFTLVELSFSLVFISILSIIIVMVITGSISSYRRGIILNQINTVGADLVEDFRTALQSSLPRPVSSDCATVYSKEELVAQCKNDKARNFVTVVRKASVKVGSKTISSVPVFGAFCTGKYSYIWNSGYFFDSANYTVNGVSAAKLRYKNVGSSSITTFPSSGHTSKIIKVEDGERAVCISATASSSKNRYTLYSDSIGNTFDISSYTVLENDPIELLGGGENNNLALYDFESTTPAEGGKDDRTFYTASFILGTVQGGINVMASGDYCSTPGGYNASVENFDYCAINKFNFAAQATGGI